MTYTAYLRIYEPVSAFHEPDRSRWADYAALPGRPRRRDCLLAEHGEALRRVIATPQVALPEQESEHAYIRRADGITYVCPWQTRLRCLLAHGLDEAGLARPHILASVWTVPLTWFLPFGPAERWLSLGPGRGGPSGAATMADTRALVYTTLMARARRRVARGLFAVRNLQGQRPPGSGLQGQRPAGSGDVPGPSRVAAELAEVGRWLEAFHPYSLVELDYGGLVHLVSDDALREDQSVAEIRAAVDGAARGERELAVAMYLRARNRWRAFADLEQAN
jgi:hypothetical protein